MQLPTPRIWPGWSTSSDVWGICCGGLAYLQRENAGNGSGASGNQLQRRLRHAGVVVTPQVLLRGSRHALLS